MKILDDGRVRCRVKITGTFKGKPFEYIDPENTDGSQFYHQDGDPSTFWWTYGNYACDCNRAQFVGLAGLECGGTINIDKIEPIDHDGETLELNETAEATR
jgi:hypothetical protein